MIQDRLPPAEDTAAIDGCPYDLPHSGETFIDAKTVDWSVNQEPWTLGADRIVITSFQTAQTNYITSRPYAAHATASKQPKRTADSATPGDQAANKGEGGLNLYRNTP